MHERKYEIKNNRLVKRSNQVPIPDNEPLFIFRAKDRKALPALVAYSLILDNLDQKESVTKTKESVTKTIEDFRDFSEKYPFLMKEPRP